MDNYDYSSDSDFDSEDTGMLILLLVGIEQGGPQTYQPIFQTKNHWILLITSQHKLSNHATLLVHPQQLIQLNPALRS